MSRISSSIGLITGIPIQETVTKLMGVAARPRDLLRARTEGLKQQQSAVDTLGSRLLAFQFALNKLKAASVFQTREVASSNAAVVEASLGATGTATVGAYQVRAVQTASAQQLISQRFDSAAASPGSGALSFRFGAAVDEGVALDELNGGAGVPRGKIRITDRSGATATVDLRYARTIDDVLQAINSNDDVAVVASTRGDAITLTDQSGGANALRVQEVGGGTTAAALGLAGLHVAADSATGSAILRLHEGTKLASLNDGNGVDVSKQGVVDLEVTLSDGSHASIDLHGVGTLGDVISQINAAAPSKLKAEIAPDGRRLLLTDLTGGAGEFSISSGLASHAAEDLGIAAEGSGSAVISGGRLLSGLKDTLLSRLGGGAGVGELGALAITDRNGGAATVDLAGAETLGEVVERINAASGANVTASINASRTGLVVTDASGGSGQLILANADATNSASKLQLDVAEAAASVDSGALHRQTLSRATQLSALSGGKGVTLGTLRVTDSKGLAATINLNSAAAPAKTVGDVIDAINALSIGVEARLNDSGDGILVVDTAGGPGGPSIADGVGNVAKSLFLNRAFKLIDVDGAPTKVIDGTSSFSINLDDLHTDSTAIPLSSLNGGKGVAPGDIRITDSLGRSIALDLNGEDAHVTTVGQLVSLINEKADAAQGGFGVRARINDAKTGIQLEDTAGGSEKLTVADLNSTAAADLKLTGAVTSSGGKQVINGSGAFTNSTATGLQAVALRINELKAGVTASTYFDGIGYRLSLTASATGSAGRVLIDAPAAGLRFDEASRGQDALLLVGNLSTDSSGALLSSPDGKFSNAVGGVNLSIKTISDSPTTITVQQTAASLTSAMQDIVDAYNSLRSDLGKLTAFDADANAVGLLFGSHEALQVDVRLSQALTSPFFGLGDFRSLEQIGLSVGADGTLALNKNRLQTAFENNPEGVQTFLADAKNGVAAKIGAVVDRMAGTEGSLLASRSDAIQATIAANDARLSKLSEQLSRQEERLYLQFYQLESIVAKFQSTTNAIQNLQVLPPLGRSSR